MKDYIKIFLRNQPALLIRQSIAVVEAMLPAASFIRIHRSFIVSIPQVTAFTSHDVEIGDKEIPVGRLYSQGLKRLRSND